MKKLKVGFGVTLSLTVLFLGCMFVFGYLTIASKNSLESDYELEKRSQFEYFGYYDKNIELPKDKLLEREYKNNNSINEKYYNLFFGLTMASVPLFGFSLMTFRFFCDCLEI